MVRCSSTASLLARPSDARARSYDGVRRRSTCGHDVSDLSLPVMPPLHETLGEITGFLERYPPFAALSADALAALSQRAEIEYFPRGAQILAQEGPPSQYLYVVRRGAVELLDEGQVIDVLEEGEAFGHPSLLSAPPPAFTARAREDSLCYLFPAEPTLHALADPAGVRFLAATLEGRLERRLVRAHRATPLGMSHVGALA